MVGGLPEWLKSSARKQREAAEKYVAGLQARQVKEKQEAERQKRLNSEYYGMSPEQRALEHDFQLTTRGIPFLRPENTEGHAAYNKLVKEGERRRKENKEYQNKINAERRNKEKEEQMRRSSLPRIQQIVLQIKDLQEKIDNMAGYRVDTSYNRGQLRDLYTTLYSQIVSNIKAGNRSMPPAVKGIYEQIEQKKKEYEDVPLQVRSSNKNTQFLKEIDRLKESLTSELLKSYNLTIRGGAKRTTRRLRRKS